MKDSGNLTDSINGGQNDDICRFGMYPPATKVPLSIVGGHRDVVARCLGLTGKRCIVVISGAFLPPGSGIQNEFFRIPDFKPIFLRT